MNDQNEPPNEAAVLSHSAGTKVMRGFKSAALAGAVGFAVPVVVMAAATAARWAIVFLISVPSWLALAGCGMAHPRYKSIEHPIIYASEVLMLAVPPLVIAWVLGRLRSRKDVPQPREQVEQCPTLSVVLDLLTARDRHRQPGTGYLPSSLLRSETFNEHAATVWKGLGFEVRPVDCTTCYRHFGTLRCLVNVLRRDR